MGVGVKKEAQEGRDLGQFSAGGRETVGGEGLKTRIRVEVTWERPQQGFIH